MEGICLKRKVALSEGALKPQKSQECCRRKEGSGRITIKGHESRRKRRKVLQKGWKMKKKGKETSKGSLRNLKEGKDNS